MSEHLDLTFNGLNPSANAFSAVPSGALEVADNVVIRNKGIIEPRRGYTASTCPSGTISRTEMWGQQLVVFAANGDVYFWVSPNTWTQVGIHQFPWDATTPIRTAVMDKSFFWTSKHGVQMFDYTTGTQVYAAGIPQPSYLTTTTSTSGGSYLQGGCSATYKAVLCRIGDNGALIQSAESPSLVVTNGPAPQTYPPGSVTKVSSTEVDFVVANSTVPHGLTTGDVITVTPGDSTVLPGDYTVDVFGPVRFRIGGLTISGSYSNIIPLTAGPAAVNVTATIALPHTPGFTFFPYGMSFAQLYRSPSAAPGVTPLSDCFQVNEQVIQLADASSGFLTFAPDITPDTSLTIPLYTNQNTGGGADDNNDLPPQAMDLCRYGDNLLYGDVVERSAVDLQLVGTDGLTNGSTIVFSTSFTFTAAAAENIATGEFLLATTGTPAQNIEATARSICRVVTTYNVVNAPFGPRVVALYESGPTDVPGLMHFEEWINNSNPSSPQQPGQPFSITLGAPAIGFSPDLSTVGSSAASQALPRTPGKLMWSNDGRPYAVNASNFVIVGEADQNILRIILVRSTVFVFKTDGVWTIQGDTPANYDIRPFDPSLVLLNPDSAVVVDNVIYCLTNRGVVAVSESGVSPAISVPFQRDLDFITQNYAQYRTSGFGVACEGDGQFLMSLPINPTETYCSQQYVFNSDNPSWTRWTIAKAQHGVYHTGLQKLVWAVGSDLWVERKDISSTDFQNPDGSAYACVLRTLPVAMGDPLALKIFRTVDFGFRYAEFATCQVGFDTEATQTMPGLATKSGPGGGYGGTPWGGLPFGISSRAFIMRADVPQSAGMGAQLSTTFIVYQPAVYWQLQAMSIAFDPSTTTPRRG